MTPAKDHKPFVRILPGMVGLFLLLLMLGDAAGFAESSGDVRNQYEILLGMDTKGRGTSTALEAPVAAVDLSLLLAFHPRMAEFSPEMSAFMKLPSSGLSRDDRNIRLSERHSEIEVLRARIQPEINALQANVQALGRKENQLQERLNSSLSEESRQFWGQTLGKQDGNLLVRKSGAAVEVTSLEKALGQGTARADSIPPTLEERNADLVLSERLSRIRDRFTKDIDRLRAEREELERRIEYKRRQVLSPLFSDPDETRRIFESIWKEIISVVNQVAGEKAVLILIDKTYGARPLVKRRGNPVDAVLEADGEHDRYFSVKKAYDKLHKAGQFSEYSNNAYRRFIEEKVVRSRGLNQRRQDDEEWRFTEEMNVAAGYLVDWFYSLDQLPDYYPSGMESIVFFKGQIDITADSLERLFARYKIKKRKKDVIIEFLTRKGFIQ